MSGEEPETAEPLSLEDRQAFMKLPLKERRRIMARQAEGLVEHYNSDTEWKKTDGGDIYEY